MKKKAITLLDVILYCLLVVLVALNNVIPPISLPVLNVMASATNLLAVLLFVGWLISLLNRRRSIHWSGSLSFLLLFVLWGAISLQWSVDPQETIVRLINWVAFLLTYIVFVNKFSNETNVDRAMWAIAVAGTLLLLAGLFQVPSVIAGGRLDALRGQPNGYALYLLVGMMGLFWATESKTFSAVFSKVLRSNFLILGTATIILSGSRGGLLGLMVTMLIMFSLGKSKKWGALGFIALIIIWIFVPDFFAGLLLRNEVDSDMLGGRTAIWDSALNLFSQHPWTGLGMGTYQRELGVEVQGWYPDEQASVHNPLFAVALDLGLPGLFLFVGAILLPVVKFLRQLRRLSPNIPRHLVNKSMILVAFFLGYIVNWIKGGGSELDITLYVFLAMMIYITRTISQITRVLPPNVGRNNLVMAQR